MQTVRRARRGVLESVRRHAHLILAGVVGCALAFWRFGPAVISPENISWFRGDSIWHFLSWTFFRNEPWSFPPGRIESFLSPLGTSIGGGDAIPLLAFPLKALRVFSPADVQYLGVWLLVNYTLQGVFGYLLVRTFCRERWPALLTGLFFLLSPVMIFRAAHIALSSHWLILFALWHYFELGKKPRLERRTYTALWLFIVGLAGLIHPYLAAMVVPVAFLSVLREVRHSGRLAAGCAVALTLGLLALLGLEWWLSGLFGMGRGGGFSFYTLNPNALFNPLEYSRFLPALPIKGGQYEGFAYLGLGVLGLGVLALAPLLHLLRHPLTTLRQAWDELKRRGHLPLLLLSGGLVLFALGNTFVFITEVAALFILLSVLLVRNLPGVLERSGWLPRKGRAPFFLLCLGVVLLGVTLFAAIPIVTSTFRAPGCFIWPVYYLFHLGLMVILPRRFPPRVAAALLLAGLLVQSADLKVDRPFQPDPALFTRNLKSERWAEVIRPFSTLAVIPPFKLSVGGPNDYVDFAFLASTHGKEVTAGPLVRVPGDFEEVAQKLVREALSGPRDEGTLYVFSAATFADRYRPDLEPNLRCAEIDAYVACHIDRAPGRGRPR